MSNQINSMLVVSLIVTVVALIAAIQRALMYRKALKNAMLQGIAFFYHEDKTRMTLITGWHYENNKGQVWTGTSFSNIYADRKVFPGGDVDSVVQAARKLGRKLYFGYTYFNGLGITHSNWFYD